MTETDPIGEELEPTEADDDIIGRVFWWSIGVVVVVAAIVGAVLLFTRGEDPVPVVVDGGPVEAPDVLGTNAPALPQLPFVDITEEAGIGFVHESGARGDKLLPECMGSGVAVFDYDGDDAPDLFFVNGRPWPEDTIGAPPTSALYRNVGGGRFLDVTASAGLDVPMYGMGVAVGDVDADGDRDLFVSALGPDRLFRNDGGRFVDVTAAAGVAGDENTWSTSAGFFDADGDGDLDLFVCTYVVWSRDIDIEIAFSLNGTDRAYGPPKLYRGTNCRLHLNRGDGTFEDASERVAVENRATGEPMGKALAVTFADIDADGDLDVIVANDTVDNFLFRNDGGGMFTEVGSTAGVAVDTMGGATGAMGADIADIANDDHLALAIANFANEASSLYVQQSDPWRFTDRSNAEGIGSASRLRLSFGLFFFDADLDGRLDLLQANGHLEDAITEIQPSQSYHQPAQLFWNAGGDVRPRFKAMPADRLGQLATPIVGRGAAYADFDGDGDLDVVLTQTGGRPLLARNDTATGAHWVRLRLRGAGANRDAIGARVALTADGVTQRRHVMPTRSYLSQVELPLTFGLGTATRVEKLEVRWPDGTVQTMDDVPIDRLTEITQPAPTG